MNPPPGPAEHLEGLVLVAILLIVAGFAGAASFTHVKDWTLDNSPPGTGEWYGWANAVISELVPTACALVIRRRRRANMSVGYPLGLLVAAVALSLAAQLAVAKPSPSGWLLSAVPALAFVALTKLVLSVRPAGSVPASTLAPVVSGDEARPDSASSEPAPAQPLPAARPNRSRVAGVVRPVVASEVVR